MPFFLNVAFGCLAVLSIALLLWQWLAAARFPLHERIARTAPNNGVTLLKPLKGCDHKTRECLRSWFQQSYPGAVQIVFGVADPEDPVCQVVRELMAEFPKVEAELILCGPLTGANLKVSKLEQLEKLGKHELLVISDADVQVPLDLLSQLVPKLQDAHIGLVNCFYHLASSETFGMKWEAVAANADFWSQVLQSKTLKPLDFALGAVMGLRKETLAAIGGLGLLRDCLADDYLLGNRIAKTGLEITLSSIVVECWSDPMTFEQACKHQLRWARTIRVCQPVPYFFSILSNAILWPLLWVIAFPSSWSVITATGSVVLRCVLAFDLQRRLARSSPGIVLALIPPVKDLLQVGVWALAFVGNQIEWRGEKMQLRRDGTLVRRQSFERTTEPAPR